jgi:CHAT domain-containing protein/Tfp pilus assembly protein PilF
MKKLLQKILLLAIVSIPGLFGRIENLYGQSSTLHDSLRHMLTYFQQHMNDEKIRQAIKEAQSAYRSDVINDFLSKKLLKVDSLLINTVQINQAMMISYAETLGQVFKELSPKQEHPDYATSLDYQAHLYRRIGQYDKALPLFQQAFAIRKKALRGEHPDYATSLNNLAHLYRRIGQYDKALPLFQQTLAIRKNVIGEEHPDYATSLNNLAHLYREMGQNSKALPLYQRALVIRKRTLGEEHPDYATSLNNLANLYTSKGQYDKARPMYLQALALNKKVFGEEHNSYAGSLYNLANLYTNVGQYDKALPLYQRALAIRKKILGEEHLDYADILHALGMLYSYLGDSINAAALFSKASNCTLRHLYQTYTTLSEQEKMRLLKVITFRFDILPSLLFTQSVQHPSLVNQVYANEIALKAMVLEDQQNVLNSIRKSGDSTTLQLYDMWRLNKTLLGKQLLLPIVKRVLYLDSLQEATNQLEQQLSRRSANFRNQLKNQTFTIQEIAQKLPKGQAAIEFISFKLYQKNWTDSTMYAALVLLPQDSIIHFIPLFEERALQHFFPSSSKEVNNETTIRKLYPGNTSIDGGLPALNDSLYALIWKPLEPYLANIHTVHYAPTGLLHRIAFQAIRADVTHLLIEKYQLNQMLSTRSLVLPTAVTQKPQTAALWGGIDYSLTKTTAISHQSTRGSSKIDSSVSSFNFYNWDNRGLRGGGWKFLPASKEEVDSLKRLLLNADIAVKTSSGLAATEEAFKALDGGSPQILHLATHGFFLPVMENKRKEWEVRGGAFTVQQNPMFRSGLVLAGGNHAWEGAIAKVGKEDGILTAYEVAQMDLSNTDLVVLSACATALGEVQDNEGVLGLQRALKMAGVGQMVISLWNVPDQATMELMTWFYRYWLGGQSTREALRNAQLKMKEKQPSPFYWAAFVIVE